MVWTPARGTALPLGRNSHLQRPLAKSTEPSWRDHLRKTLSAGNTLAVWGGKTGQSALRSRAVASMLQATS
eukprot:11208537-Lingulodinium_polyedra.AAC.1